MEKKFLDKQGLFFAFSGYLIWGLLPLYWKQIKICSPSEILSSRLLSFLLLLAVAYKKYKVIVHSYIKDKKIRTGLMLTAAIVSLNWVVYIYAVNNNELLQASMGYYINPFLNIFFGIFLLKEKIDFMKAIAVLFALGGVMYMIFYYGSIPWISIVLALSFSLYGLLKKIVGLHSVASLFIEMALVFPVAFIYQIFLFADGSSHFTGYGFRFSILILLSGAATVIPLLLFTEGAKKIPYSTIGILQFFAPTLMFLIGVFIYDEPFTQIHKISFLLIWTGVLTYMYSLMKNIAKSKNHNLKQKNKICNG